MSTDAFYSDLQEPLKKPAQAAWFSKKAALRYVKWIVVALVAWAAFSIALDVHSDHSAYYLAAKKRYASAEKHVASVLCQNPDLELGSGEFSNCQEARDTLLSRPEYTAMIKTLHSYKLCSETNCVNVARNVFGAMAYFTTGSGIVIAFVVLGVVLYVIRSLNASQDAKTLIPLFMAAVANNNRQKGD